MEPKTTKKLYGWYTVKSSMMDGSCWMPDEPHQEKRHFERRRAEAKKRKPKNTNQK